MKILAFDSRFRRVEDVDLLNRFCEWSSLCLSACLWLGLYAQVLLTFIRS